MYRPAYMHDLLLLPVRRMRSFGPAGAHPSSHSRDDITENAFLKGDLARLRDQTFGSSDVQVCCEHIVSYPESRWHLLERRRGGSREQEGREQTTPDRCVRYALCTHTSFRLLRKRRQPRQKTSKMRQERTILRGNRYSTQTHAKKQKCMLPQLTKPLPRLRAELLACTFVHDRALPDLLIMVREKVEMVRLLGPM